MPISSSAIVATYNIQQFAGDIWYVSSDMVVSGDGRTPTSAFKTITEAITAMSAGDAVAIKAGTYAENVILNKNYCELWPEIGTIINPASGNGLTVSANYCQVWMPGGSLRVNGKEDATGVLVTGNWAYLSDIRVPCDNGSVATSGDIGFDIQGDGCVLENCRSSGPDVAAFKISGDKAKLGNCCTGGNSGYSSIGFWVTGSCDKTRLKSCGSQGHETSGYQIDTGCTNGVIEECYSGGGDGRWSDADNAFVFSDFYFDDKVRHTIEFSGAGAATENLFKITGAVRITALYGLVTTVLSNDIGNVHLELYDGTNTVDVTDAPGPSFDSLPVGTYVHKTDTADVQITIENSSQVRMYEDASRFGRDPEFQIVAKNGADTYLRLVYNDTGTSGAMKWFVEWAPLTDDGYVEAA